MPTHCNSDSLDFGSVEGRAIVGGFDGGTITSDAGALLLGATNKAIRLVERFAATFTDARNPGLIEHSVPTLVGQRVFGLALGYQDINDHDLLRHDPVLAALMGKMTTRRKECAALAGKSTLNRLEHAPEEGSLNAPGRYHKISHDGERIERLFVDLFLEAHATAPELIVLDPDATDVALHGHQEGRFFHGFYDQYCYLPLYIFCGRHLLAAKLRRSNIDAAAGIVEEMARIVTQIRERWPKTTIVVRADSGFCRDGLMTWCEDNNVHFVLGLAKNDRLIAEIGPQLVEAEADAQATGRPARRFKEFAWTTRDSWTRERRVVAKAEWTGGDANPRFIVTSLDADMIDARRLYEDIYCKRGEMENRIKETKSDLFGDRTSASTMRANQLRMWFSAMAYVLVCALRRIGLAGTGLARATCATIRLQLLKIGAQVTVSVRRVKIALASGCPQQDAFITAHRRLSTAAR
jgi:Transposase DDE domain group 1